ncbi:MAG: DsrE family protein [Actinobacteria bacterium]|nr:DsrE family protein [Actinomycetota bacterium]
MKRPLVLKVTVAGEAPERCVTALTVATAAVAAGTSLSLWLSGEATWLATGDPARDVVAEDSPSAMALIDGLIGKADIKVCSQCASRRGIQLGDLLRSIKIGGAATFVYEITQDHVQAVVY